MAVARFLRCPLDVALEDLRRRWSSDGRLSWTTDDSYDGRAPLFDGIEIGGGLPTVPAAVALQLDLAEEATIKDEPVPTGAIQFVGFATIPPAWSRAAYHDHWRDVHGPLAAKNPYVLRYLQFHTHEDVVLADGRRIAGFASVWFADLAAMRASATTPEQAAVAQDERTFIEGRPAFFLAREVER
jgi:uncharacterized protein (TIGR02118 family)